MSTPQPHLKAIYKSKTLATWCALLLGALGFDRLYLYGLKDKLAWLYPIPTLVGLYGVQRMAALGQEDRLAWVLIPILGIMISIGMLTAIVHGLTPDERWDTKHNPGQAGRPTAWGPVLGAIVALLIGGAVLMGTIAFAGQRYFESRLTASSK